VEYGPYVIYEKKGLGNEFLLVLYGEFLEE
jgi:hypothetical protein